MMLSALVLPIAALSASDFPADFVGDWRGTMEWSRPGQPGQKVAMRLKIERAAAGTDYTYLLAYVSVFSVGGNTIQTHLSREGDTLVSIMTTFGGGSKTGGKDGVPEVTAFQVLSVQRAVLRRSPR